MAAFVPLVRRLLENTRGRDFVVGDLHGCLPDLKALLTTVSFNPDKDRLIAVGDLVDRGPESLGVLRLLGAPWFTQKAP